jgi:hypothetical protein
MYGSNRKERAEGALEERKSGTGGKVKRVKSGN